MLHIILAALTQPACLQDLDFGPIAQHFPAKEKYTRRAIEDKWWKKVFVKAVLEIPQSPLRVVQTQHRDQNNVMQVRYVDCKAIRVTLDRTPPIRNLVGMTRKDIDKIDARLFPALRWVFDNGKYGPPPTARQQLDEGYTILEHYQLDHGKVRAPKEAAAIFRVTANQRQQAEFQAELQKRPAEGGGDAQT